MASLWWVHDDETSPLWRHHGLLPRQLFLAHRYRKPYLCQDFTIIWLLLVILSVGSSAGPFWRYFCFKIFHLTLEFANPLYVICLYCSCIHFQLERTCNTQHIANLNLCRKCLFMPFMIGTCSEGFTVEWNIRWANRQHIAKLHKLLCASIFQ